MTDTKSLPADVIGLIARLRLSERWKDPIALRLEAADALERLTKAQNYSLQSVTADLEALREENAVLKEQFTAHTGHVKDFLNETAETCRWRFMK